MDNYIKIGKRYKALNVFCMLCLIFAMIAVGLVSIKLWIKVLLVVLLIILFFIALQLVNYGIRKFLVKECNPEKYYAVSRIVHGDTILFEDIAAMVDLGDFNRALSELEIMMKTQKGNKIFKIQTLLLKIECLFSTGQYEECLKEISAFRAKIQSLKINQKFVKANLNLCNYFESFINKDYKKCIAYLDTFDIDRLKRNYNGKHTFEYYYALTYYYSGDMEKAKAYFERLKDVNDTFYYSIKAKQYLESINEDRFLELNFDEIPKYERQEFDLKAKKKADRKMYIKAVVALVFAVVIIVGAFFFVKENTEYKGTPQEIIMSAMGFDADIKAILPIENENAVLCVFQDKNDRDYLFIAYFEKSEQDVYEYGTQYEFLAGSDGVYNSVKTFNNIENVEDLAEALHKDEPFVESFDDNEYYFKSGKKDICVTYKVARNEADIPDGVNAQSFIYTAYNGTEKTYYIYISSVEKEKSTGYESGIADF